MWVRSSVHQLNRLQSLEQGSRESPSACGRLARRMVSIPGLGPGISGLTGGDDVRCVPDELREVDARCHSLMLARSNFKTGRRPVGLWWFDSHSPPANSERVYDTGSCLWGQLPVLLF